jgi:hypothetical protein
MAPSSRRQLSAKRLSGTLFIVQQSRQFRCNQHERIFDIVLLERVNENYLMSVGPKFCRPMMAEPSVRVRFPYRAGFGGAGGARRRSMRFSKALQ